MSGDPFPSYHDELVPRYERACAALGIEDPPGVVWVTLARPGITTVVAQVLFDRKEPDMRWCEMRAMLAQEYGPASDQVIGPASKIAVMAAELVAARFRQN